MKNGERSDSHDFAREVMAWLEGLTVGGRPYREHIAEGRTGDEADVVDRLFAQGLLARLGYEGDRVSYNQRKGSERPDWLAYLEPGGAPYFLVEDKATGEDLAAHQEQLFRYMRRLGVPRGVLTNGRELLVYEMGDGPPVPVIFISFRELLEGGLFQEESLRALRALHRRLARERVQARERWIEDLTKTEGGEPHAKDGSTWPAQARIRVTPARGEGFLDRFTEEVKGVLGELKEDALAQLRARLKELETAERKLRDEKGGGPEELERRFNEVRERFLSDLKKRFGEEGLGGDSGLTRLREELRAPWERGGAPWRGRADQLKAAYLKDGRAKRWWATLGSALEEMENLARLYEESRHRLEEDHREAAQTREAFARWKARYGFLLRVEVGEAASEERALEEFATQTAYVFFVRLLLVRVAEDVGLLPRMFTNGGVARWLLEVEPYYMGGEGGSPEGMRAFLSLVFGRAQREVYAHFFTEGTFDWYRPSRTLALELLWKLAHYDFSDVDQDIVGHLYAHYATEEHRHHTGMYYTPPEVVDYILDRVGFGGKGAATATLLDPACGSGTFLVRAARRVLEAFRDKQGRIPEDRLLPAIKAVTENLVGLDVNPFACYLAEINLLVQVMDLLKELKEKSRLPGEEAHLDRFRVHHTDTLVARFPGDMGVDPELFPEEAVKGRAEAFDFVVGNPPYVRADAPGVKEYREAVARQLPLRERVEGVLKKKWDLYVPFVALALEWAKPSGRVGLLVSASVESAPFAEALRKRLLENTLLEVAHLKGKALFPEAVVDNAVLIVQKGPPPAGHEVLRRRFPGKPSGGPESEERSPQEGFAFPRHGHRAAGEGCVPLGEICYVSRAMELHAGDGSFRLEDLLSDAQDQRHPRPYVDGSLIEPFAPKGTRWLEYGPGLRAPEKVRGPTFPELWDREKLLLQRILSTWRLEALWDRGQHGGFLAANHSAIVAVRWWDLKGVERKQLGKLDDPKRARRETLSQGYTLGYLVGVLNTEAASRRAQLHVGREGRVEANPEALKSVPIPEPTDRERRRVERLARLLEDVSRRLALLEEEGWNLRGTGAPKAPAKAFLRGTLAPLGAAEVAWGLEVVGSGVPLKDLSRDGNALYARGKPVARAEEGPEALDWFVRVAEASRSPISGRTWSDLKGAGFQIPRSADEALRILAQVAQEGARARKLLEKRRRLEEALEDLVEDLYRRSCPQRVQGEEGEEEEDDEGGVGH